MAFSGGSAYFMHRGGVPGSGSGTQVGGGGGGGFQGPPGFRALSSNPGIQGQSNARVQGGSVGPSPTFSVEPQARADFNHGSIIGASSGTPSSEPVKKKRGRPRKYGPDGPGPVSLKLSPMSAPANPNQGSTTSSEKRGRGRPPGSGRKQQLALLGIFL